MKKIIFLSFVLSSFVMNSQSRDKGTIELTPVIGYATSNYTSSERLSNDPISSVNFGADFDYFFNDRWSLRSGLSLLSMGSDYGVAKDKLKYLTVPVNANWHFGSTRKWNLNFGLSVGFLTSAESNGVDVKEFVNSTQVGLNLGIGYKIEVSEKFSILVDYQGLSSFSSVAKESEVSYRNTQSAFNVGGVFTL